MFKHLTALVLTIAPLLAGCQMSPAAAPAPVARTAAATPLTAHAKLSESGLRHVLDNSATLWGVQFGGSYSSYDYRDPSDHWATRETWNVNATLSGPGQLIKASRDRYVFQVPDGQVLVLNQVAGVGSVAINGFWYSAAQPNMHYVFGPGELVVLTFTMTQMNTYYSQTSRGWSYQPLAISGYLADPALIGGQAGVKQK